MQIRFTTTKSGGVYGESNLHIYIKYYSYIFFIWSFIYSDKKIYLEIKKKSLNINLDPSFLRPFFGKGARELSFFSHS